MSKPKPPPPVLPSGCYSGGTNITPDEGLLAHQNKGRNFTIDLDSRVKHAVRVATTGSVTLSGLQTIDGVSLVAGDRVLVKDQTNAVDNGIYGVRTGAWCRTSDARLGGNGQGDIDDDDDDDGNPNIPSRLHCGTLVPVCEGTQHADTVWIITTDTHPILIGTSAINFGLLGGSGSGSGGGGFDFKGSVRVATTANITLSGLQTVDGVALAANDRVLVKDQTTGSANGIYVAKTGAWTRATDFDSNDEVTAGSLVAIEEGTASGDSLMLLATNNPIV